MARSRVGIKGSNQRRIKQRDEDSDESDEEYKVTDDEDLDESDECYSLDGEESEEISADFGKSKRVSRLRNNRSSSGKRVNRVMKPRKRRKVSYTEDDDDDDDDDDDADFMSFDRETNQVNKHREKKRVSYSEEDDDDDDEDGADSFSMDRKDIRIDKPREKKRVSYAVDDDDDDDDEEFVFSGRNRKQRKKPREKKRVSYTEEDDDDDDSNGGDDDEDVFSGRNRKQRKKHREKKRVVYTEDVDADGDDLDLMSFDREANQVNKPIENGGGDDGDGDGGGNGGAVGDDDEYGDDDGDGDEDYKEFGFSGRNRKQRTKPREKKKVIYTDDDDEDDDDDDDNGDGDDDEAEVGDEDDANFLSLDRKANQIKKPAAMKRDSYPKMLDDDDVDHNDNDDEDQEEDEDDDNYEEFMSSGRKRNHIKSSLEKKVVYTEDDTDCDNDDDFMYSGKNIRGKSEVSYTEEEEDDDDDDDDDHDDSVFMSTSRKRNQINKRREKRIVSYKEDNQEEEDENDAEFKLSESDFVDDEDETPKTKKNKIIKSHLHKKTVRGAQKKNKIPKQRNRNKTKTENQSKTTKRRKKKPGWQKPKAESESDSDFVNSASSDHEYTISEEEREQMREARVYCANLRAKLRNQEKQPTYEQKKYPIRKGKEKIEETKDDIGKQVCGICLSEEQKRTMRGVLSCCCHYFCFSCIMEWSKVETRCPLCKQRFTTITKAAKSDTGFDLRTIVIPVPECDQVYEPSEEELRGYLDPYESVICTECHNGGDDALMLLCDICDSSAHTFCVGLGREVPDGNWYCDGCRPTVFGTLNSDLPSSSPITGGFDLNELYVPETPLTQQTRVHSEPNPGSVGTVATTLRDRRRLHRQIHHRFLNNNSNNRMSDLSGRTSGPSGSSSGIRLFGSQLGEARVSVSQNDHVVTSVHDSSNFYSRPNQFSVQGQGSNLASADVALQDQIAGFCNDPPVH